MLLQHYQVLVVIQSAEAVIQQVAQGLSYALLMLNAEAALLPADANSFDTIGFLSIFIILSNIPDPPMTLMRIYLFLHSIIIY